MALSPNIIELSDSLSGESGDDIFVTDSDEGDIVQDSDSEVHDHAFIQSFS